MTKTYLSWLHDLPDAVRISALAHTRDYRMDTKARFITDAIDCGLRDWDTLPRGAWYWEKIYNRYFWLADPYNWTTTITPIPEP